jgi:hypothetical protein
VSIAEGGQGTDSNQHGLLHQPADTSIRHWPRNHVSGKRCAWLGLLLCQLTLLEWGTWLKPTRYLPAAACMARLAAAALLGSQTLKNHLDLNNLKLRSTRQQLPGCRNGCKKIRKPRAAPS